MTCRRPSGTRSGYGAGNRSKAGMGQELAQGGKVDRRPPLTFSWQIPAQWQTAKNLRHCC